MDHQWFLIKKINKEEMDFFSQKKKTQKNIMYIHFNIIISNRFYPKKKIVVFFYVEYESD